MVRWWLRRRSGVTARKVLELLEVEIGDDPLVDPLAAEVQQMKTVLRLCRRREVIAVLRPAEDVDHVLSSAIHDHRDLAATHVIHRSEEHTSELQSHSFIS